MQTKARKILIADDEPDILEIVSFNLQAEGYEVFTAKNYDAVAYYKTSRWMEWLRKYLGEVNFNKAMQEYFR